jgi:hypothetical protein
VADPPLIDRRAALRLVALGGLGLLAGCRPKSGDAARSAPPTAAGAGSGRASASAPATTTPGAPTQNAPTQPAPTPSPTLDPVVQRAADAERALLSAYDTALLASPELGDVLAPLRADHAQHLQGLVPGAVVAESAVPSQALASALTPSANPSASAAVVGLVALESAAADARIADLATASGSLARLLASIGACESVHAATLGMTQ